jgi:hypothetical protein
VQVEGESAVTRRNASIEGERSARTHTRSKMEIEDHVQHTLPDDDDNVPGALPEPPPPVPTPDETARRPDEALSAELEGEW